jgi:anti-anti-sigma factor
MQQAEASVQLQQGNATSNIVDLHGSFSDLPEEFWLNVCTQVSPVKNSTIIMNGRDVESMNSRTIRQIIRLLVCTRRQHLRLLIFGLSDHNRYILEITRLSEFIEIVNTQTQTPATVHLV